MTTPLVTVLMPVYNGEAFIAEALQSILQQSYPHFELLIINDGSTDRSADRIAAFSDPRIRLIDHPENKGIVARLNEGLQEASGSFIARMDADDISFPGRLEAQVGFMQQHLHISICGTHFRDLSSGTDGLQPTEPEDISIGLIFQNVLAHPTVMIRRQHLLNHHLQYEAGYPHTEDYRLWTRCALAGLQMANLPDVWVGYRTHQGQVSSRHAEVQQQQAIAVTSEYVQEALGVAATEENLGLHRNLTAPSALAPRRYFQVATWCRQLLECNQKTGFFNGEKLSALLDQKMETLYALSIGQHARPGIGMLLALMGDAQFRKALRGRKSPFQKMQYISKLFGG